MAFSKEYSYIVTIETQGALNGEWHTLLAPALMDSICSRCDEKLFFSILRRVVPESGVISNPMSFEN